MTTAKFTFSKIPTAYEIARGELDYVTVEVLGFWSNSVMALSVKPFVDRVEITITHSSGGRLGSEVACDLEAANNFASAMIALASLGADIKKSEDVIKTEYLKYRAELAAARVAATEKSKKEFESDLPMSEEFTKSVIRVLKEQCNSINLFNRGQAAPSARVQFSEEKQRFYVADLTVFRSKFTHISKTKLIELLMTKSTRNTACAPVKL